MAIQQLLMAYGAAAAPSVNANIFLFEGEGTNGSYTGFVDGLGATVTATPDPPTIRITTSSPIDGSGSILCAGGALFVPSQSAFNLGTGDFEVYFDFRATSWSPSLQGVFNIGSFSTGILIRLRSDRIELFVNGSSNDFLTTLNAGTTYAVEIKRSGNNWSAWVDGVQVGSTWTLSATIAQAAVTIGRSQHNSGEHVNGLLDRVRLRIPDGLGGWTNRLLINANGDNNSIAFVDDSTGKRIDVVGSISHSTEQFKFGSSSIKCKGGALTTPSISLYNIGTAKWRCFGSFYINSFSDLGSSQGMINIGNFSSGMLIRINSGGFQVFMNGTQTDLAVAISTNTWIDWEIRRDGTSLQLYINNALQTSATISSGLSISQGGLTIGRSQHTSGEFIDGYMDRVGMESPF